MPTDKKHGLTHERRNDVLPARFSARSYDVVPNLPASWTRTTTSGVVVAGGATHVSYSLSQP